MPLRIGIIGLPNVGKSTLFNVLTQTQKAEVANYPFCTIEPNLAVVPVPDKRLDKLADLVGVDRRIQTTIEFLDIAGLVKGANQGEGLGNKFLGTIRNTDALLHVVRCFEDPNVIHVSKSPHPKEDIGIVKLELILADLEQIEKKLDKLSSQLKGDKKIQPLFDLAEKIRAHLGEGLSLAIFPEQDEIAFGALNRELRFLSSKPVIYAANIGEEYLNKSHPDLAAIEIIARAEGAYVVQISAQVESDLNQINEDERSDFLEISGIKSSGLEQVIRTCYRTLNLISFFTYNENEVRSWTVEYGASAPQAAGKIHTDFEKGFIKAEVIPFDVFDQMGSAQVAKEAGKLQIEGRDYLVKDGDVIYFRFNK